MSEHENNGNPTDAPSVTEHLNIKVTDNNNEVFFKIKRSTKLEKLMSAFCDRQGKNMASVRFLFEGQRVQATDTPDTVCFGLFAITSHPSLVVEILTVLQLEMQDGDTLEVHQEQVGGGGYLGLR